jgi:transcriptional regulator with XRE-family HTH domain
MSAFNQELFAATIQAKRKWSNLNVTQAAKEVGISLATLSRIENNHPPDLMTYYAICKWLTLDMNYFFSTNKALV